MTDKSWAIVVHLSGILLMFNGPLLGFIALKERSAYLRENTRAALNFQLTVAIAWLIGAVLSWLFIGIPILFAVTILSVVFSIIAAVETARGDAAKYPFAIQFVK